MGSQARLVIFGDILHELRRDCGLTQQQLGKRLGVSCKTISSYECAKSFPDSETLIKISQFFNVTVDYLLGLSREIKNEKGGKFVKLPDSFNSQQVEEIRDVIRYLQLKQSGFFDKRHGK